MRTVEVALGERSYPVLIGSGLLARLGELARTVPAFGRRCAVVSDANVAPLYGAQALEALRDAGYEPTLVTVAAGETSKSMAVAEEVCDAMIAAGLDRKGWVIALGGGVVGDLAGFAAAIYYRGIPFVQVPTTIIAQVDSAVGGKTGVNARGGKNLIGAFHQPRLVLADVDLLSSLPEREWNEGFAEIIKHAAIADASLLDALEAADLRNDPRAMTNVIERNVRIKADIVSRDEHETLGLRALLNFGHTVGHGIENAAGYGELLHGEAISLGLAAAARLSVEKAGLAAEGETRLLRALEHFRLPLRLPPSIGDAAILSAMEKDKKFSEGAIRFVLSPRLGEAFVSKEVSREEIRAAIASLR